MKEFVTTVGNMKKLVRESSNEFKAKIGPGVESADKQNNGKAYSDAKERAKKFDGGLSKEVGEEHAKYDKTGDDNGTTLGYNIANASDDYKKRVHSQVKGYSSPLEEKNGTEKNGNFDDNEEIYKELKRTDKEKQEKIKVGKESGLAARVVAEKLPKTFEQENMYESKDGFNMRQMINHIQQVQEVHEPVNETIKTVYFKKTKFITENHMITKIPDDFKTNGLKFNMKDKDGNVYLVEWKNNKANVISHINKNEVAEEFNRMKQLMEYKTVDTKTTTSERLHEGNDDEFRARLNRIRELM